MLKRRFLNRRLIDGAEEKREICFLIKKRQYDQIPLAYPYLWRMYKGDFELIIQFSEAGSIMASMTLLLAPTFGALTYE